IPTPRRRSAATLGSALTVAMVLASCIWASRPAAVAPSVSTGDDPGALWAWGSNGSGQLGTRIGLAALDPTRVEGPRQVVAAAAGASFSLALANDGAVWTWGSLPSPGGGERAGQHGTGLHQVLGLPPAQAIGAGQYHALAVAQDGTVWGWGNNRAGQATGLP